jgi:hypothetical protein
VYDPAADRWSRRTFIPRGERELEPPAGTFSQVEAYDPRNNTWSSHMRMPTSRHGLGAAPVAGRIYVISGGPTPGASVSDANEIFLP